MTTSVKLGMYHGLSALPAAFAKQLEMRFQEI